jgi:hypothetical protein
MLAQVTGSKVVWRFPDNPVAGVAVEMAGWYLAPRPLSKSRPACLQPCSVSVQAGTGCISGEALLLVKGSAVDVSAA